MAEQPTSSDPPVAKVVRLRPDSRRRAADPSAHWLLDHVRELVSDVDAFADELRGRDRDLLAAAGPPATAPPAPEAAKPAERSPAGATVPDVRARSDPESPPAPRRLANVNEHDLLTVPVPSRRASRPFALRLIPVAAERIADPRMGVRRVATAARVTLGWRAAMRRMAVAAAPPHTTDTPAATAAPVAGRVADPVAAVDAPEADGVATPPPPEPAVAAVAVAAPAAPRVAEDHPKPESPDATAVADQPHDRARQPIDVFSHVLAVAVCFCMVACVLSLGSWLTGHHMETVVTPSMVPTIPVGSMVITEKLPTSSLRTGDIIVFPRPTNTNLKTQQDETIVHRIQTITTADGYIYVTTKGDANGTADCWNPPACPVKRDAAALSDRVILVLPGFGDAAADFRLAAIVFVVLVTLATVIGWAARMIRATLRDDDELETAGGMRENDA